MRAYAALAMQVSVACTERARGLGVQIRVGLNSSEVVVRTTGSDLDMDYTAVGQTTHFARAHGAARSSGNFAHHG
jgi:class 3 adenylate cyclase